MKKILLAFISLFFITLITAYMNLDIILKKVLEANEVQINKVTKLSIEHWKLEGIQVEVEEGKKVTVESANIKIIDLDQTPGTELSDILGALKAKIELSIDQIAFQNYKVQNVRMELSKSTATELEIRDIYISDFGKYNKGYVKINLLNPEEVKVRYQRININKLVNYVDASLNVYGYIDIIADLNSKTIKADIISNDLILKGFKLDDVLTNFVDSRKVGLIDAASIVTLGPIGLLYTSAGSIGMSLGGFRGGQTSFDQINLSVILEDGILELEDVGIATKNNLVVVNGKIDLEKEQFENIVFSILDPKYCPVIQQTLKGTFKSPDFSKTSAFVDTAVAPVTNIKDNVFSFVGVQECTPIYNGAVKFPINDGK